MNQQHEEENLLQYEDCEPAGVGIVCNCSCERCEKGLTNPYGQDAIHSVTLSAKRFLCPYCYALVQDAVRKEKERYDNALRAAINAHYDAERERERKERKRNWKEYISNCIAQSAVGGKRKHSKEKKRKGKRK